MSRATANRTLRLSTQAVRDLDLLHRHIAREDPAAADKFEAELVAQMDKLAQLGLEGRPRDTLRPGLRSFPYKRRTIFFDLTAEHLTVARILHQSQNVIPNDFAEADDI